MNIFTWFTARNKARTRKRYTLVGGSPAFGHCYAKERGTPPPPTWLEAEWDSQCGWPVGESEQIRQRLRR